MKLMSRCVTGKEVAAVLLLTVTVSVSGCGGEANDVPVVDADGEAPALEAQDAPSPPDVEIFENTNRRLVRDSFDSEIVDKVWGEDQDSSGLVRIRVYECTGYASVPEVHCGVDPDEVLVGGGAWADYGNGWGAFLTASYPENNDLETWVARSKDHLQANQHTLHSYAIGMTLQGVDRTTLKSKMTLKTLTSGSDHHPGVSLSVPAGFAIIGGGARVNYQGAGNMLTESYPTNATTWKVGSKDHNASDPSTITAFAIGIATGNIPGFGTLDMQQRNSSSAAQQGVATATKNATSGWATTCAAGRSTYSGAGRMLFRMMPTEDDNIQASSKDHVNTDSGSVWAYSLEARKH